MSTSTTRTEQRSSREAMSLGPPARGAIIVISLLLAASIVVVLRSDASRSAADLDLDLDISLDDDYGEDDDSGGGDGDDSSSSFSFTFPETTSSPGLVFGFYDDKCPDAEEMVSSTVRKLYHADPTVAPALVRLFFHDCFIHGCDASVLLDGVAAGGERPERDAAANQSLRGMGAVEAIKRRVEAACPGTVSCADILALAARDSVVLVGGPAYPVLTGRRDSARSFYGEVAGAGGIPPPNATYAATLAAFARRGREFTDRETVALLGAHSIGKVRCRFFADRIYDFAGTGAPDTSMDRDFVREMRAVCGGDNGGDDGDAPMEMGYYRQGREVGFGAHYYGKLLEGRGILRADQQLTAGSTVRWVRLYADGARGEEVFRRDFARAMVKLSALSPLTGADGQVRITCSRPRPTPSPSPSHSSSSRTTTDD